MQCSFLEFLAEQQAVGEAEGIKNNEIYLSNMSKSFGDKAWFVRMVRPEVDMIVDFGGGAGEFCEFVRGRMDRPVEFVVIDNNPEFKAMAERKGFTSFESLDQLAAWKGFRPERALLNMSSVIHEVYAYADDFYDDVGYFWQQVKKCGFRQIAIRDMSMSENSYRTAPVDDILWVY